jgi:hypothetical protein
LHIVDDVLKNNGEDLLRGNVGSKRVENLESELIER